MWRVNDTAAALLWVLNAPLFPKDPAAAVAIEAVVAFPVQDVPVDKAYSGSGGSSLVPVCRIMVQPDGLGLDHKVT